MAKGWGSSGIISRQLAYRSPVMIGFTVFCCAAAGMGVNWVGGVGDEACKWRIAESTMLACINRS